MIEPPPPTRFENVDSTTFWEITLDGNVVSTCSARIGASAYAKERRFDSPELAHRAYERMIAAKRGEGFWPVEQIPVSSAETLVNVEYEAAIIASPDDANGYLIYADWLMQQGDVRGELIAVQHALEAVKDPSQFLVLKQKDEALRHAHAREWLGVEVPRHVELQWRRGFVASAEVIGCDSAIATLLDALTASPAGRLLRSLTLNGDKAGVFDALPAIPPVLLRSLTLRFPSGVHVDRREVAARCNRYREARVELAVGTFGC
jgi:uncharacterized protein (TIGR02996 family)